ncbi:MAG: glycosyltransferase family 2 protein [Vulcanimicrobiaceae bacterium]
MIEHESREQRSQRTLISVVVPAYNEEECVDELARRLKGVADSMSARYDFEFVIIENGSADTTFERLIAIRESDPRFKIVRFSRNFGIEGAVTAGLRHASGDAAIIMTADLQDPPELIPEFVAKWEDGYQNVYGIVSRRHDESRLRRFMTKGFYWLLNILNEHPVPRNVSDFRLVDRKLFAALNTMDERNRMLRTMWGWVGYRSIGVEHERPPRFGGKSTYKFLRNVVFGLHGIASSTNTPLRVIPMFGVTLSILTFILFLGLIIRWIVRGVPFSGFGTIVGLTLVLFSLLFLLLGILSEYIGIIYEEVRQRPIYIVNDTFGF